MKKAKVFGTLLAFAALLAGSLSDGKFKKDYKPGDYMPEYNAYFVEKITDPLGYVKLEKVVTPSDNYYSTQKSHSMATSMIGDIESTWDAYTGKGTKIAIIDNGFDYQHSEYTRADGTSAILSSSRYFFVSGNYVTSTNYSDDPTCLKQEKEYDNNGNFAQWGTHGTNTSTTAAAPMGNGGVVGIAPEADILALKVDMSAAAINSAIAYATNCGVDVINMSVAVYNSSFTNPFGKTVTGYSGMSTYFNSNCQTAYNNGIIVVASAGNDASTEKCYPACSTNVIGVGALGDNTSTTLAPFTNYNASNATGELNVDIFAPGYVYAAGYGGTESSPYSTYNNTQGTSFSSPIVAGAACLWKQKNRSGTPSQFLSQLQSTASGAGNYTSSMIPSKSWGASSNVGPSNVTNGRLNISNLLQIDNPYVSVVRSSESIAIGQKAQIELDTYNGEITYSSGNSSVATVSESGQIRGVATGSTTISVIATKNNTTSTATVSVTVGSEIACSSISFNPNSITITAGDEYEAEEIITTNPSNASRVFLFESSDETVATVDEETGTITGIGVGQCTITAIAIYGNGNADLSVTVESPSSWSKITSTSALTDGDYLIVYEAGSKAFNGGLQTLDAVSNTISVTITSDEIAYSSETEAAKFTINAISGGYSIRSASGIYIGPSSSNGINTNASTPLTNVISFSSGNAVIGASGGKTLYYNTSSGQYRFRYMSAGASIQLYKLSGSSTPTPSQNYTVTFNSNGGSGTMANQTTTGSTYTTPSCGFNRSGYTCNNWALNGTDGTQYAVGETISNISANITLYAIWTQNSGSTFVDDYGTYYDGISNSSIGDTLRNALYDLNEDKKSDSFNYDYDNLRTLFQYVDLDWTDTSYLVGFYDNHQLNKAWDSGATWNREHVWPKSRNGNLVEGDLHMVRPTSTSINSARGNKFYGTNSSTYDPGQYAAEYRGIAARIIFYCAIADKSLSLINASDGSGGEMGDLSDLLQWNLDYLPSKSSTAAQGLRVEQYRNKAIYTRSGLQGNRNPFIDHPEYACRIWGRTDATTRSICGITDKTLSSLTQTGTPTKTTYEAGESFDPTGLTITAHYSDGTTDNVTSEVTWTPNPLTEGTTSVTGSYSYGGGTAQTVTVTGITVTASSSSGGGDAYSLTFSTAASDSSTALTTDNLLDKTDSNTLASSCTAINKVYEGTYGVKLGSSSANGSFTINLNSAAQESISSLDIDIKKYGSDTGTVNCSIGGQSHTFTPASAGGTLSWTFTSAIDATSLTVSTSAKRAYVKTITLHIEDSGGSQEPQVNSIVIPSTLNLDLNGNSTYTFSPTIDADEGADTSVTWVSSNTSVAQITSGGQVTALSTGQTTITATCGDKSAQCTVTVVDTTPIRVTGVSLNKGATSIAVGSTETLTATITPSNATNKSVSWISSVPSVATVNNGTVSALAIGTTVITVTTADGGYTDTCTVEVTAAPTITYELEADSSEVPFNSGTNHIASVGVTLYQYNNGVKSEVSSGSVNVDTSSLGRKTVQFTYSATTYTTTVKVTNHGADIGETIAPHEETTTVDASVSHTFTAANTTGMPTGWSGSFSGTTGYESARGVQLQKSASCTITTPSYTNIKSITVYLAKSNNGKGSFTFKIGNSSVNTVTTFNTTSTAVTYSTGSTPMTGAVQISGTASASSLYIKSITINYQTTTSQTIPGESHDATKLEQARAWATYFISETRTAETCLAELDSQKLAGLQAKWEDLAYEYSEMIGDSKDEFCTSNDATIVEARNHYLFIVSKFGASNLGEDGAFVKNSQNQVLSAKANNPLVFLKGNSSIPIIVIMSVISVTSIGLYFYLRKRKEE